MANRCGNNGNSSWLYILGSKITPDGDCSHEIKICPLEEKLWLRQHIKKQRHYFANKSLASPSYGFSSSHACMDVRVGLKRKLRTEELMLLNYGIGEDSWESLGYNQSIIKEINPEYSLEGLKLKLKLQYFGHLMQKSDSLEKDSDARKDWRQKKRTAEDEMVR